MGRTSARRAERVRNIDPTLHKHKRTALSMHLYRCWYVYTLEKYKGRTLHHVGATIYRLTYTCTYLGRAAGGAKFDHLRLCAKGTRHANPFVLGESCLKNTMAAEKTQSDNDPWKRNTRTTAHARTEQYHSSVPWTRTTVAKPERVGLVIFASPKKYKIGSAHRRSHTNASSERQHGGGPARQVCTKMF
jgi:hypothetical protein